MRAAIGIWLLTTAWGCRRDPSPEQLQAMLIRHPEVLYAVVRAHPAEFVSVLNEAAQTARGNASLQDDSARVAADFIHPRVARIDHRAVLGNPRAPITIVEYSDFECPYCRHERGTLVALMKEYGDSIRLVVKQTPLDGHPEAMPAALMYEAVARQDPMAAYRFYDDVFEHQPQLRAEGERFLEAAAARSGVDVHRAVEDARSPAVRAVIASDQAEAQSFGFMGTPSFLVDGISIVGEHPLSAFENIIRRRHPALTVASAGSS